MSSTSEKTVVITAESVPRPRLSNTDGMPLDLALIGLTHPERAGAEAFVRTVYARTYGARLVSFYPVLLRITRPDGSYIAVAGIRPAGGQVLFSEYYLPRPIEMMLGTERCRIVEVGNLAPASAGQTRWLIGAVTAFLAGGGFSNVVFTAVPRLKNAFSRMGLPLVRLANARPDSLPDGQTQDWGSYYEQDPAVFSGDILLGFRAFTRFMTTRPELCNILQQAHAAGAVFANRSASPVPTDA